MHVVKTDGRREPVDVEKIHIALERASKSVKGVSISEIENTAKLKFFDGIQSKDINKSLISACVDLTDEENPNYHVVAANLIMSDLRKAVYGQFDPWHLKAIIERGVAAGLYDRDLIDKYSDAELNKLNSIMKHDRDFNMSYAGAMQVVKKYLVKDRTNWTVLETPQVAYLLIPMAVYADWIEAYPGERLARIREFYETASDGEYSISTPNFAGARTPTRQFSSCVLMEADDGLPSIFSLNHALGLYVARKAGIGAMLGHIRSEGSPIRNGEMKHTGFFGFWRATMSTLKSCSQGGVRDGSASVYYPMWHKDFANMIVLKNGKGTEENRLRHMDYGVTTNDHLWDRFLAGQDLALFDPTEVPDMRDAYYSDPTKFAELYERYMNDPKISKKIVPAAACFEAFALERSVTGRIYVLNIDNANDQGPYDRTKHPIKMSNLCAEILLYTRAFDSVYAHKDVESFLQFAIENGMDEAQAEKIFDAWVEKYVTGRIALCTLGSVNFSKLKSPKDLRRPVRVLVQYLNQVLRYQDYPVIHAKLHTEEFAPLGIGILGFAHWMAKNGMKYGDPEALKVIDLYMQHMYYYFVEASVDEAERFGPCKLWKDTCYGKGQFIFERRHKNIDKLVPFELDATLDWEGLRQRVLTTGIANTTGLAMPPVESSSQPLNTTNGIEMPLEAISTKSSKDGSNVFVVPEYEKLKNKYEYIFDQPSPRPYLRTVAVIQKWTCQSISANTNYNPDLFPDKKIPMNVILGDMLYAKNCGVKTLYYSKIKKQDPNEVVEDLIEAVSQPLPSDDDSSVCESCVL